MKNFLPLLLCSALFADFSVATNGDFLEVKTCSQSRGTSKLEITADDERNSCHLLSFPDEILLLVAQNLINSLKDTLSFGATCNRLHAITSDHRVWGKYDDIARKLTALTESLRADKTAFWSPERFVKKHPECKDDKYLPQLQNIIRDKRIKYLAKNSLLKAFPHSELISLFLICDNSPFLD